jgi:predicted DNA-binding transcriptional regulator YafY
MDRTERFYRIRQLLATRQVVPISAFLSALSVSRATFTRDIEYLRDRLNVPVVWDRERRGYRLTQDGATELPGVWLSAEEIRALLAMEGLLEAMQSGVLRSHLAPVRARLEAMASSQGLELAALQRRVRVVDSLPRQTDACVVTTVLGATIDRRRIDVEHYNRERGEVLTRQLSPQTVLFYRNAWYVHAWCHLREAVRVFGIDAMRSVRRTELPAVELDEAALRERLEATYGIFDSPVAGWARIRFSPPVARWVSAERWHPQQRGRLDADGSYEMEVPFGDERELLMDIMRYGPQAEVLAPPALRDLAAQLHAEAAQRHADRAKRVSSSA